MKNYHIKAHKDGWEVEGEKESKVYTNQEEALTHAKKLAQEEDRSVIIHDQSGKITSVIDNGGHYAKGKKIKSAPVKSSLDEDKVRVAIARAMEKRRQSDPDE
ncbi:MAG: DUF2188 domain-containing protein [Bacteroidota bacterium]